MTKLGLYGGPRAKLQIVVATGAFVAGNLAAPTMSGTGVGNAPQTVTGSGAFSLNLAAPTQSSTGLSSQNVSGTGAFSLDLAAPAFAGAGIGNVVALGTGAFQPSNLTVSQASIGTSAQGVWPSGGVVEWGLTLSVSSSGTGAATGTPDVLGVGAFAGGNLDAPIMSSTGQSVPPQQVTAIGTFVAGNLATPIQVGLGDSNPSGTISGQGALLGGTLSALQSSTGTSIPPQAVAAAGAFTSDLQATQAGVGTVTGILGTGAFSLNLSGAQVATGQALPPPTYDLGWEDDDVTWGGLQLTSKDLVPVAVVEQSFFLVGQATNAPLALFLERQAVVYEPGFVVLGTKIIPDIEGADGYTIQISLGGHRTLSGAVDWEGPYDFVIGEDDFADFAVSGKYLAVKFESTGVPQWTLQSYTIEYEIVGRA